MNEDQKKWLLYLQEKGIKFEIFHPDYGWENGSYTLRFCGDPDTYRIHAQPIPDIPDWRELCREMQEKGIKFEVFLDTKWYEGAFFNQNSEYYRIPQQPIPEWREEMTEETKPGLREENPHRELQIQWHEDCLHHLRTGEPMPVWEYRLKNGDGEWKICHDPHFSEKYEYRRKPRTVKYWHCVVNYVCDYGNGAENVSLWSTCSKDELESEIKNIKDDDTTAKFSPIIETTVEMDD